MSNKLLKAATLITLTSLAILAVGCSTTGQGSKTYTRGQAQQPMRVQYGTVLAVADVTIETQETGVGAAAGGVVGGILGHAVVGRSGSNTKQVGATAGALAGAAAGSATERAMGTAAGVEIEVELDDGQIFVIVQGKDDDYAVGDKVRVLTTSDGTMRVRQ